MSYKVGLPPEQRPPQLKGDSLISKKPVILVSSGDQDPILTLNQWYPDFKEHHLKAVSRIPDWAWLRENRPDLDRAIRNKEAELDTLKYARLSEVMAIMREWRKLILQVEFEWKEASKQVPFEGLVIEEDKPLSCRHCNKKKGVLYRSGWRKGGKIIRRIRADGGHVWACHFCGREARGKTL